VRLRTFCFRARNDGPASKGRQLSHKIQIDCSAGLAQSEFRGTKLVMRLDE